VQAFLARPTAMEVYGVLWRELSHNAFLHMLLCEPTLQLPLVKGLLRAGWAQIQDASRVGSVDDPAAWPRPESVENIEPARMNRGTTGRGRIDERINIIAGGKEFRLIVEMKVKDQAGQEQAARYADSSGDRCMVLRIPGSRREPSWVDVDLPEGRGKVRVPVVWAGPYLEVLRELEKVVAPGVKARLDDYIESVDRMCELDSMIVNDCARLLEWGTGLAGRTKELTESEVAQLGWFNDRWAWILQRFVQEVIWRWPPSLDGDFWKPPTFVEKDANSAGLNLDSDRLKTHDGTACLFAKWRDFGGTTSLQIHASVHNYNGAKAAEQAEAMERLHRTARAVLDNEEVRRLDWQVKARENFTRNGNRLKSAAVATLDRERPRDADGAIGFIRSELEKMEPYLERAVRDFSSAG